MLEYAASDTRYLEELSDLLAADLEKMGRASWAQEEFEALEAVSDEPQDEGEDEDPVVRVKGARDLPPREVAAIRAALEWRDEIARAWDRAPFRVIGDKPLIEAVGRRPSRVEELRDVRGFPGRLAGEEGKELLRRLRAVAEMPQEDVVGYPRNANRGPGRPPPEVEAVAQKLKTVRNRAADRLGLPKGTLLSNATMLEIALADPGNRDELLAVEGMRRWKAEVLGDELLEILRSS
jgi:ribonuclease D